MPTPLDQKPARKIFETGGPTVLDIGSIPDGSFGQRVGTTFVGNGGGMNLVSVSGATTLTSSAFGKVIVCSGSSNYALTLPTAVGNAGKVIVVVMASGLTALVTVTGHSSELISGQNTRVMWAGESAILMSDGTNWFKVNGTVKPMACSMQTTASTPYLSSVPANIQWNYALTDPTGMMADISGYGIKIPRAGNYRISTSVLTTGWSSTGIAVIEVQKVSGPVLIYYGQVDGASGANEELGFNAIIPCAAGDEIVVMGASNASTVTVIGAAYPGYSSYFSAEEVPQW